MGGYNNTPLSKVVIFLSDGLEFYSLVYTNCAAYWDATDVVLAVLWKCQQQSIPLGTKS